MDLDIPQPLSVVSPELASVLEGQKVLASSKSFNAVDAKSLSKLELDATMSTWPEFFKEHVAPRCKEVGLPTKQVDGKDFQLLVRKLAQKKKVPVGDLRFELIGRATNMQIAASTSASIDSIPVKFARRDSNNQVPVKDKGFTRYHGVSPDMAAGFPSHRSEGYYVVLTDI